MPNSIRCKSNNCPNASNCHRMVATKYNRRVKVAQFSFVVDENGFHCDHYKPIKVDDAPNLSSQDTNESPALSGNTDTTDLNEPETNSEPETKQNKE